MSRLGKPTQDETEVEPSVARRDSLRGALLQAAVRGTSDGFQRRILMRRIHVEADAGGRGHPLSTSSLRHGQGGGRG